MSEKPLQKVLQQIRRVVGPADHATDAELLERFRGQGDEAAFTALLQRHGALVWGVCRRVLGNEADAADAFQATFLVLARKAAAIQKYESVGSWLHGVAYRTARRAKVACARRRAHERRVETMPRTDPLDAVVWRDVRAVLDEELDQLAEKYRAPLVLCYLEGKTHEEAARHLGWTNGTVCGRLARARDLLRSRLSRRGLTLSVGLLAAGLAQEAAAAAPPALLTATAHVVLLSTAGAAGGLASVPAARLADATVRAMSSSWHKTAALLFALGLVGTGAGVVLNPLPPKANPAAQTPPNGDGSSALRPAGVGKPFRLAGEQTVLSVAFAPADRVLAVGDAERLIRLWQPDTGKVLSAWPAHESAVAAVAFAPDGKVLASAGYDGQIHFWEAATGRRLRTIDGHQEAVSSLAFAPDGNAIASAGWDGQIHLWETATGRRLRSFSGHRGKVWSVSFSPDGRTLASAGGDKTIRLWDVLKRGDSGRQLGRHRGMVYAAAFSPDGNLLASGENNGVTLWNLGSGQEVGRVQGRETAVIPFAFSPDGRTLAWADEEQRIHLRELATGKDRLRLTGHHKTVACLAFAGDGRHLASGSADTTALVWDLGKVAWQSTEIAPSRETIERFWNDLGGEDAVQAYRAVWGLAENYQQAAPVLQDRLRIGTGAEKVVDRLIADLDSDSFALRERASAELKKMGAFALPAVRRALEGQPSLEARRRMERLVDGMDKPGEAGSTLRAVQAARALEALELAGTPGARQLLETLAEKMPEHPLRREAEAALGRMRRRDCVTP